MDEHADFEPQAVLTPRRRRGTALGVIVVVAAVAGTVGAGLLGPRIPPMPESAAVTANPSDAVAVAPPSPAPTLPNFHPSSLPRYPASVLGLRVQPAAYIDIDSGDSSGDSSGLIAVAGWYAPRPGTGCPTPRVAEDPALAAMFGVSADPDTFCDRSGMLFTAPTYGENVAPIMVELRPGVPTPYALRSVALISPVVLVGRLIEVAPACRPPRSCQPFLLVDRVAWSGGRGLPRMPSVLPRLLAYWPPTGSPARDRLVAKAIGDTGEVLLDTLVDPGTLARIDPGAAHLLARTSPAVERIWYRRVLGTDPARDPVLWVAVDDATGNVIGSGAVAR